MKKLTITIALTTLFSMSVFAHPVDVKTAQKVATTFLNNNGAKSTQLTDLSKAAGFPNLYIFTAEQGFVVMAADDCVQPILGYSLTGKFVAENMPTNVSGWLQGYSDEIQYAIDSKAKATAETAKQWKDLIDGNSKAGRATPVVAPLIQTKWNQNKYFNNLCPIAAGGPNGRAFTGCVATAMAQIMKYHNYPTKGIGSHSYTWNGQTLSANFCETNYDWGNMGLYYEYYYPNPTGSATWLGAEYHTSEKVAAVATLLYHCGVSVDMNYGGGKGSSASTSNVATALKIYFNYNPNLEYIEKTYTDTHGSDNPSEWDPTNTYYSDVQWIAMLKAELNESRPMVYRGADPGSRSGHSFVCDGYDDRDYFHFNWGWAGSLDGYFTITNLNTGANTQSGAGNGNYTRDQAAIFGIRPSNNNNAPSNLTYTMQGLQGLTLSWDAATGNVASYNVFRNGNLVGNTTSTTYSETAPFGNNEYYVRSVDANGELSLPTNTVSVFVGYQQPVVDDLTATLSENNANLTWTAPEWCYPETHTATLNYGSGNVYYSWTYNYYGHRHLASNLAQYSGKGVYKVSTYILHPGTYSLFIYSKSTQYNGPDPNSLSANINSVPVTISNGWYEFVLSEPVILTGTDDLWVVLKQENTNQQYPTPSFNLTEHNTNAFYAGSSPIDLYDANSNFNCAWLINTFLTDGTYTYNLYQDGTPIAQNLTETTYNATLNDDAANLFTVKTKFYGGETAASNAIGFAKGTASVANLEMAANDQMTITDGSKLTVNGTMSNSNAANLVLEDGAQLFHSGSDVYATVKKDIAAYTTEKNGWNFIASPIATQLETATIEGLIPKNEETTFDLYKYNEPNHKWYNYKPKTDNTEPGFAIEPKTGYLYASSENTTLSFAGKLHSASSITSNTLSYSADVLKGFNLVGNPLPFNAYVSKSYYKMNDERTNIEAVTNSSETVAPCTGIIVEATGENENVIFGQTPMQWSNRGQLQIAVAENKMDRDGSSTSAMQVDNAIICFDEADPLQKFVFNEANSKLYIPNGDKEYAIVSTEAKGEMPLNFKPTQDGTFTLTVQPESVKMGYLFLIDNMTGTHINLLTTPNYTFEAKTGDYESRFKLLFAAANEETETFDNESFGFIINGQFQSIIGQGLLQVIDLNGRILRSANETDCIGLDGLTAGVYVIRFITANSVRTQKIVVE